jgi:nitronate monooxygenase
VFSTCQEALTPGPARGELLDAAGDATELTREFDVAAGCRWPAGIPERVLRGTPVNAGQGVGVVRQSMAAAELVRGLRDGALDLLSGWS